MPKKLGVKIKGELEKLLEMHDAGYLSGDDREKLHRLLKEKYAYGDKMPEYKCPECEKPLVYTWASGPLCITSDGGCGFSYSIQPTTSELISRLSK